jgi:hypothetical protein
MWQAKRPLYSGALLPPFESLRMPISWKPSVAVTYMTEKVCTAPDLPHIQSVHSSARLYEGPIEGIAVEGNKHIRAAAAYVAEESLQSGQFVGFVEHAERALEQ